MPMRKMGQKNDARVVFAGRVDADTPQVELGRANRVSVLYLTWIAKVSAQDLLVLGVETRRSALRAEPRRPAIQSEKCRCRSR
ncbi:hypothetical protein [Bradyrhizobium sp. JR3.5]